MKNPFRDIYDMDCYKQPYNYPLARFPYIIDIEATNCCNLDCLMCGRQIMTRKQGNMSIDDFKKVADEVSKEGCKGIRIIRWGEPLLNPTIFEMIRYAKKQNLLVHMTTNGLLLTEKKIRQLIDVHLDSIIFSFQGTTKKEYQRIRNNNEYDKLKWLIQSFSNIRKEMGVEYPYMTITTTVLDESKEMIQGFYDRWNGIVDIVDHWFTSIERIREVPRAEPLLVRQGINEIGSGRCNEVMTKLSVNWNGDVTACCGDFDGVLVVGNIHDETLKEIWTGERLSKIRGILRRGEKYKIPFCSKCTPKF